MDDDIVDGPQTVAVEVWAPGWAFGYGTVQVRDDEANALTLTLPASIPEARALEQPPSRCSMPRRTMSASACDRILRPV